MTETRARGRRLEELATPCFVVDAAKLARNAGRFLGLVAALRAAGHPRLSLRPHVKTHKTVEGAHVQLFGSWTPAGAEERARDPRTKVCVSTVGEAAFYVEHGGFQDVLLAVPIGKSKLARCAQLRQATRRFTLLVDHEQQVGAVEEFWRAGGGGEAWSVFLQVDCGGHRCGVAADSEEAVALGRRLLESPAVELRGLYTHGGHAYHQADDEGMAEAAKEERLEILAFALRFLESLEEKETRERLADELEISIGSTPSLSRLQSADCLRMTSDKVDGLSVAVTELHPGNYIFYDVMQAQLGSCALEDCAGTVLASVISKYPARCEVLLDSGALALSKDTSAEHVLSPTAPKSVTEYGQIVGHPDARLVSITQELGVVRCSSQEELDGIAIGSTLQVVPNHSCLTAACFPEAHCYNAEGVVIDTWETAPRKWV